MSTDTSTVQQILHNVFGEMLGLSCQLSQDDAAECNGSGVSALISIVGPTKQSLIVEAPQETARRIAAAMYQSPAESLGEADIHDAVAEIANIVGGNMKGTTDGESRLSIPRVTADISAAASPGERRLHLLVADHPLLVRWSSPSPVTVCNGPDETVRS